MSADESNARGGMERLAGFVTTHWSVVLAAKAEDTSLSAKALEKLCQTYWPPLYAYIRREGYNPPDAQDLTQEFLSRLVHKEWLNHLQDQRGKFRSFLLTFLKHFLSDERDRANAQKRGGGVTLIPFDAWQEERTGLPSTDNLSADQIYDRRWARVVTDEAARRLREEYVRRGKSRWYEQLNELQSGEPGLRSYAEIAAQLGVTEQAVKNAVYNLRRRYGQLLREEIAQTVTDPAELQAEIRHLLQVFAS